MNFENWKKIKLGDLFTVKGSGSSTKRDLNGSDGSFAYVTTQSTNNGVSMWCDQYEHKGNVLTIDSAAIGFCSYQAFNFIASDSCRKINAKKFYRECIQGTFFDNGDQHGTVQILIR